MRKSTLLIIVVIIALIVGAALAITHKNTTVPSPTSTTSSSSSSASQTASTGSIEIRDMMFTPSQITIAKGGTVTWTNNDSVAHTVVDDLANVGGPSSGNIAPGATYSFTFDKTGSFQYHCTIHPSMRGTIVVK